MRTPLTLLIAVLLAATPFAAAQEASDGKPETGEREVKIEKHGDHAVIKLEEKRSGAKDELKIDYDASKADMKVEFKSNGADTESKTELRVKFRELIEYVDTNGNNVYDLNTDRVVQTVRMDDKVAWTLEGPTDVAKGGITGKKLVGHGAFQDGGSITFALYVYGVSTEVNGTTLRPSEVKIDILIDEFPYQESNSALGLVAKVEHKTGARTDERKEGEKLRGVEAVSGGVRAYFSWAGEALVDNVSRPVTATPLHEEGNGHRLVLNYPRGTHINHDPVMGVASAETSAPSSQTPGPGTLMVAAAAGLVALALTKRAGRR